VAGPIRLVVNPATAHPGEIVTLAVSGARPQLLMGGNITTFEAPTPDGWSVADYVGSPAQAPGANEIYGIVPFAPKIAFAEVGLTGPVKVRVPDDRPGTYRFVRFYDSAYQSDGVSLPGFPKKGGNLCASVDILATPPALRVANDVAVNVTPSSGLQDGERVTVSLRGFGSGAKVWLSECAFGAIVSPLGCGDQLAAEQFITTGPTGSARTTFVVSDGARAQIGSSPSLSCTTNCVIVATLGGEYGYATSDLEFAHEGAAIGTFRLEGGPFPGLDEGVAGRVTFRSTSPGSSPSFSTTTAGDGEFSIVVPPGRYAVTAESPMIEGNGQEMRCAAPGPVVVKRGVTANVSVSCDVP
jgi:hypothetical protein